MENFFTQNLGTLVTGLIVFGGAAAIAVKLFRDIKKGKHPGCAYCRGCEDSDKICTCKKGERV